MKELKKEFVGKGQVKGFVFTQLEKSTYGYVYKVNTGDNIFYEVLCHKENKRYNCVSYPTNKAFGVWAWAYSNLEKAINKLDDINLIGLSKLKK
jgi:hypothetical protein